MSHDIDVAITYRGPNPTIDLECSGCGWTKNMGLTTSPEAIAEAESQHLLEVKLGRGGFHPPHPDDIQVWEDVWECWHAWGQRPSLILNAVSEAHALAVWHAQRY